MTQINCPKVIFLGVELSFTKCKYLWCGIRVFRVAWIIILKFHFRLCFSSALVNGTFHFQYPSQFSFFAPKTVFNFVFNFPLSLETDFPFKSVAVSVQIRCLPEKYRRLLWGCPSNSLANREGSESLLFTTWFFFFFDFYCYYT